MADRDWKSYMEIGAQFAESIRGEVERVLIDLASEGKVAQGRAQAYAETFADANRARVDAFLSTVKSEVSKQVGQLGIATQADLVALERRLSGKPAAAPAKKAPAKKAPAKKAPAKKAPAKKAPAKKAPAKKAPAKKAPAKKAPAKKAPAKKAAAPK